jgi:hypothetical protein
MRNPLLVAAVFAAACTAQVQTRPVAVVEPAPVAVVTPAPAGNHPAYLHALTDLRVARGYLQRPAGAAVKWDENRAIREIDAAIAEIRRAAIDDGKSLDEHPSVDQPTWGGRLQRSLELLNKARADISEEEDSPSSQVHRLRGLALEHIDNAIRFVHEGEADARSAPVAVVTVSAPPPTAPVVVVAPQHPAYLHALTDLRHARALLAKPARADVKFDENLAIREIDAAIREIREAAIDDGKPLEDHPPVDAKLHHRDRLRKAEELLHKAAADIDEKEDNGWAKGLRGRANGHIHNAEHAVHEAMEDRHHGH